MYRRVLVVAAHPDDEVLGAGGTIRRLVKDGAQVRVLFLATGVPTSASPSVREEQADQALRLLGITDRHFCRYADQYMDVVPLKELAVPIEAAIQDFEPDLVLTHHVGDVNQDHVAVHWATMIATRPKPETPVLEVWAFEVVSSTEWGFSGPAFVPTVYVDVTTTVDEKLVALAAYGSVMQKEPHPRSYEGVLYQAKHRGTQVGVDAAEAFMLMRRVV